MLRALIYFIVSIIFVPQLTAASEFETLSCSPQLFHRFPQHLGQGCHKFTISEETQLGLHFTTQIECHFPNQVTAHVYQHNGQIKSDFRGFSGGYLYLAPKDNITRIYETCTELLSDLIEVERFSLSEMPSVSYREFSVHDSVTIAASEENCQFIEEELHLLLKIYLAEGRSNSNLVCIPQTIVELKNPALVRQYLAKLNTHTQGIMLLGDDIPPFELFFEMHHPMRYIYAASDLPYGNDLEFWDKPLPKTDQNSIIRIDVPSVVAYNINLFTRNGFHNAYVQRHWVSRYLGHSLKRNIKENLQRFLQRRALYLPVERHNILMAASAWTNFARYAGQHSAWAHLDEANHEILKKFPMGTDIRTYVESDLEGITQHLDKNITFLSLAGHGSGIHIGQFSADAFSGILWLPILVNLETCFGGYWMYGSQDQGPSNMLITNVLHTDVPPLAVTATQAGSWISKFYKSIRSPVVEEDVFLTDWSSVRTLGQRQKETIEFNLRRIDRFVGTESRDAFWRKASFAHQMFATYSIFGDGTVEF